VLRDEQKWQRNNGPLVISSYKYSIDFEDPVVEVVGASDCCTEGFTEYEFYRNHPFPTNYVDTILNACTTYTTFVWVDRGGIDGECTGTIWASNENEGEEGISRLSEPRDREECCDSARE
jgi:hypothetical protein